MTSTTPTRPAWNRQVSSRIANDGNSVGLSAVAQNLLSAKPIIDLIKKIAKLTLFLPETVPLATEKDDIPHRIFELEVLTRDSGGDREPTKPAGKIADPRPSFTKDAGYEKKMDDESPNICQLSELSTVRTDSQPDCQPDN
ncbi:hypothetical protein K438DRAFT_1949883 [Mycena galopus ATCC 62051]|nr:hypothetical protein K438DRAFT_1949883 [Mycena galopus ATCC 62051]